MGALRYRAIRGAFEVLALPGVAKAVRRRSKARGAIFTLHRVLPGAPPEFSPNAILQVTPAFLDVTVRRVRELGIDLVDLDEALRRTASPAPERPFVALTFDDAYRDNLVHALPVLRKHAVPFALYVPTAMVDGAADIWWQAIEDVIALVPTLRVPDGSSLATGTLAKKNAAFDALYAQVRPLPAAERRAFVRQLAEDHGFDLDARYRELIMDWDELRTFADEPLCTLGTHTVHHYELSHLTPAEASDEITDSIRIMEERLGERPVHLCYPVGGPASAGPREYAIAASLGLRSAVTTIPGGLYPGSGLHDLPRISLNGLFQKKKYVDVFATPAIFRAMARV